MSEERVILAEEKEVINLIPGKEEGTSEKIDEILKVEKTKLRLLLKSSRKLK